MRNRARTGFTLLEVVLAIAIGALLLLAVHAVLLSADASRRTIERRTWASRSAAAVFSLLARDLAAATMYRDAEIGFAGTPEGDHHRLDFTALVPSEREVAGRASMPTEVGYLVRRDPAGGPRYRLYRREQFYRDATPTRGGNLEPICDGVVRFRARYHDGTAWRDRWTDSRRLPRAVEITLVLAADDEAARTPAAHDTFLAHLPIHAQGFTLTLDPTTDNQASGSAAGSESAPGSQGVDGSD